MNRNYLLYILFCLAFGCIALKASAQEHAGPRYCNALLFNQKTQIQPKLKKTALSLPFFDDFTGYNVYPDANKWVERQVYINNTMCINPPSRGVATFDALNEKGLPWDPYINVVPRRADSLTSQPIDLSSYTPGDSLYLSFFYQPQGYGFYPLTRDSLLLMVRVRFGDWVTIWKAPGTPVTAFNQVMVPITDTLLFYSSFQFRFVNIASLNYADAVWNVDYVRMNANRTYSDTAINDIAFSKEPTSLLNDYVSMPYRQFYANAAGERTASLIDSVHNNIGTPQNVTSNFSALDLSTGTILQTSIVNTTTLDPWATTNINTPAYTNTVSVPAGYDKVVFQHTHYLEATTSTGPTANDTVVKNQVFDNYLAYDDGSAEQSYYLTLLPTLPGKLAIEHHLNTPDTLRGMAFYFARTAPPEYYKTFDIYIYSTLQGVNGAVADNVLYRQLSCDPGYIDTINHFYIYKFDTPLAMPAGTFYSGVLIPAESGADSLHFGLDVNRIGGNHAYYNVMAAWSPSVIQGAIMMRPLLGQEVTASRVTESHAPIITNWRLAPNPATETITLYFSNDKETRYCIYNISGTAQMSGVASTGEPIGIQGLPPGTYCVYIFQDNKQSTPIKLIKL